MKPRPPPSSSPSLYVARSLTLDRVVDAHAMTGLHVAMPVRQYHPRHLLCVSARPRGAYRRYSTIRARPADSHTRGVLSMMVLQYYRYQRGDKRWLHVLVAYLFVRGLLPTPCCGKY